MNKKQILVGVVITAALIFAYNRIPAVNKALGGPGAAA